jgi:hypothetical protein
MIQLYLFLINVCDTCLIFIGGKVVLIGWKRSLESWVCLIWKLMYWYTVHTIRAFVTQVFTRLFLWNIINNIIVLLSYWIRVSLSSWCYCHHGVIVILMLLSSWCYWHPGVLVWISTVLVTKTVNVNWFLLKHCIWWLQVTSPI